MGIFVRKDCGNRTIFGKSYSLKRTIFQLNYVALKQMVIIDHEFIYDMKRYFNDQ